MGWLQFVIIAFAISACWTLLGRGPGRKAREAMTQQRVSAYIETIRRERARPELTAMSDSELADLLHAGARRLRTGLERRTIVVIALGAATLVVALTLLSADGLQPFLVALVVGALATYGTYEFSTRRLNALFERQGLDPERLRIE